LELKERGTFICPRGGRQFSNRGPLTSEIGEGMQYGGPLKSVDDLDKLRSLGFDFGEVVISSSGSRLMWWESGIKNQFDNGFFLLAHGPLEDTTDDAAFLWNKYMPALIASVDTARRMGIELLTVHMNLDKRFVAGILLAEKVQALKKLVPYGLENGVIVSLENVSESASDLEAAFDTVPDLRLTLDVGHAQLSTKVNRSFDILEKLGSAISHIHLHDNRGGLAQGDDLHLPIGTGIIDFSSILQRILGMGYDKSITFEVNLADLSLCRTRVQQLVQEFQANRGF